MQLFIIFFLTHRLDISLTSSYITKVERVVDLPVGVLFLKPTIEYGSNWGALLEDFYVSVDCNDRRREIYIELGANCFRAGPFYRTNIGKLEVMGIAGFLRIDVAALATGEFGGYSYAGQVDEERNGGFFGLKLRHNISERLSLHPFFTFGMISMGSFWEYGCGLAFKPFIKRHGIMKRLAFTTGLSIAHLGYTTPEAERYTLTFGYYLVGVSYELVPPKKPKEIKLEVKVDTPEVKKTREKPEAKEKIPEVELKKSQKKRQ